MEQQQTHNQVSSYVLVYTYVEEQKIDSSKI
jgi:hypothetical protein